jgi:hypothetical protein
MALKENVLFIYGAWKYLLAYQAVILLSLGLNLSANEISIKLIEQILRHVEG